MGATKRKAAKPAASKTSTTSAGQRRRTSKAAAPKTAAPRILLEGRHTEDLKLELVDAADSLLVNLQKINDALEEGADVVITDEFHQQAKYLLEMEAWGKDVKGKLKTLYIALRDAGATFEHGRFAPQFKETSRRSVKWQEEAIRLKRKLAALEGDEFDEKVFVAQVQAEYPKTSSTSLAFAELG